MEGRLTTPQKIGWQLNTSSRDPEPTFLDLRVRDEARVRLVRNTTPVLQNYGEDVWIADGSELRLRLCFTSHPNDATTANQAGRSRARSGETEINGGDPASAA